ncbi:hypothetical protein [Streptomyces sp. NPDC002779]|uniref:hypothetical protein n=1 Tax=Streptomyces sp. NPDC002779 TaxID=3364664 RepID=UPI003692B3F2
MYLDEVLAGASGTDVGMRWRKRVVSATKGDLDMLFDGEQLNFCNGAPRRSKNALIAQKGQDEGAFVFLRQEAARNRLC